MTITVDATKGWARPANASEWTELLAGTGLPNPDSAWPCTEASGNLADVIGSLTLSAIGSPNYAQPATGWTGTGVGGTDNTTDAFVAASGVGPSPASTSQTWLFVVALQAENAANRIIGGGNCNGANFLRIGLRGGGTNSLRVGCNGANVEGSADHIAGDYVIVLTYDRAGSRVVGYSDLETVTGTYSAGVADGNKGILRTSALGDGVFMYVAMWSGANAEGLDDTDIATIMSRIESPPSGITGELDKSIGNVIATGGFATKGKLAIKGSASPSIGNITPAATGEAEQLADPPGPTIDALVEGSLARRWVFAIEGYPNVFTDAERVDAAIEAYEDDDFEGAIGGLYLGGGLHVEQNINPWEAFPGGGTLTVRIAPDEPDTFGKVILREGGGRTFLDASVDCDDTTLTLKSNAAFASSGVAYCGTEAIAYTGKASGPPRLTGCTRGKYSPLLTATGDNFAHAHRMDDDPEGFRKQPVVTVRPLATRWAGKWCALRMHVYDVASGLLNERDDARLVFAGRIKSYLDNPNPPTTDVTVEHVLDCIKDAVVGENMWSATMKEGISLFAGFAFRWGEHNGTTPRTAAPLMVVPGPPADEYEIQAGRYSIDEICSRMNVWLNKAQDDGDLFSGFHVLLAKHEDVTRGKIVSAIQGSSGQQSFSFELPEAVWKALGTFGGGQAGNAGHIGTARITTGGTVFRELSVNPALRHINTGSGQSFEITDEKNEFIDQQGQLPNGFDSEFQGFGEIGADGLGMVILDGRRFAAISKDGDDIIKCVPWLPIGTQGADFFSDFTIEYDDPRGPIEVRQYFHFVETTATFLKKLFYSTGTQGHNHATFDVFPVQVALGIPGEILGSRFEASVDALPVANKLMHFIVTKPIRLVDLLGGDLNLRFAFLRWKDEGLQFWSWMTPINGITLDDSNKAGAPDAEQDQRAPTKMVDEWQRNIIKIEHSRDLSANDGSSYVGQPYVIADRVAIDDAGGRKKPHTIKAANTYASQYLNAGGTLEDLLPDFIARASMFTRPVFLLTRTLDPRYWERVAVGDTVRATDVWARDPNNGERGVQTRPGIVVGTRWNPGGLEPGPASQAPSNMEGDVTIMFLGLQNVAPYVPTAQVDHTETNGGLIDTDPPTLRCLPHEHSEPVFENSDATYMTAGREVLVIEIDPEDPDDPLFWETTVVSQTGNDIVLEDALTDWDSTKKYRVIWQKYSEVIANQQTYSYQADDGDAQVEDLRDPFEYVVGTNGQVLTDYTTGGTKDTPTQPTANSLDDLVELPARMVYGDGRGVDVGHQAAINRLINNLFDFRTAKVNPVIFPLPYSWIGDTTGFTWQLAFEMPVHLSNEGLGGAINRQLNIRPLMKSSGGTASVRVTLARRQANDSDDWNDVDRGSNLASVTFTSSSSSFEMPAVQSIDIGTIKDIGGHAWLLVEISHTAELYGLPRLDESRRLT